MKLNDNRRRVLHCAASVFVLFAILSAFHSFGIRTCLIKRFFGIPCLTCGTTRGMVALVHGDVVGAFAIQPLMVSLICAVTALALVNGVRIWFGREVWRPWCVLSRLGAFGIWLAVAAVIINWIYLLRTGV